MTEAGKATGAVVGAAAGAGGILTEWYRDRHGPRQKVLGELAALDLRDELEKRKAERRARYTEQHIKNLEEMDLRPEGPLEDSNEADQMAFDWCEGIGEVNPDDKELSAIWYAALTEIKRRGSGELAVFDAIRNLTAIEAAVIISSKERRPNLFWSNYFYIKKERRFEIALEALEKKGLVKKISTLGRVNVFRLSSYIIQLALIAAMGSILFSFVFDINAEVVGRYFPLWSSVMQMSISMLLLLLISGAYFMFGQGFVKVYFKITAIGRAVSNIGRKEISRIQAASGDDVGSSD